MPWTMIRFMKKKGRWYVTLGDRRAKLENVYNCPTVKLFMNKFGFVSECSYGNTPSIFSDKYIAGSSTYKKEDVVKMKLVQKLVDQRIKASLDYTAKLARKK